jgi:Amt family ammonium transporter
MTLRELEKSEFYSYHDLRLRKHKKLSLFTQLSVQLILKITMAIDPEVAEAINLLWILVAGIICFFLQAGFGLLEVGAIRAKNAQSAMIKNLMDACVAAIVYYLVGYGFAYGENGNAFVGSGFYALYNTEDFIIWYFNYVFAGTTATIVSGAVAERCKFEAYLIYSSILSAIIYPIASHWIWSPDGWMFTRGVLDFAGGGAVHGVGGCAALMGAYILGPRIGKFTKDERTGKIISCNKISGHNLILSALGGFIL